MRALIALDLPTYYCKCRRQVPYNLFVGTCIYFKERGFNGLLVSWYIRIYSMCTQYFLYFYPIFRFLFERNSLILWHTF